MNFKEWNDGLYYSDTRNNKLEDAPTVIPIQSMVSENDYTIPNGNINYPVTNYSISCSLLHTVDDNKQSFFPIKFKEHIMKENYNNFLDGQSP